MRELIVMAAMIGFVFATPFQNLGPSDPDGSNFSFRSQLSARPHFDRDLFTAFSNGVEGILQSLQMSFEAGVDTAASQAKAEEKKSSAASSISPLGLIESAQKKVHEEEDSSSPSSNIPATLETTTGQLLASVSPLSVSAFPSAFPSATPSQTIANVAQASSGPGTSASFSALAGISSSQESGAASTAASSSSGNSENPNLLCLRCGDH